MKDAIYDPIFVELFDLLKGCSVYSTNFLDVHVLILDSDLVKFFSVSSHYVVDGLVASLCVFKQKKIMQVLFAN